MKLRGRLKTGLSDDYRNIVIRHELAEEESHNFFESLLQVNIAHVLMLHKQKLITRDTATKLLNSLTEIWHHGPSFLDTSDVEDIYFALEKKIIEMVGIKEAGNIHLGRSRNDLYATTYSIAIRQKLLELLGKIMEFAKAEIQLAEDTLMMVMPGYTHTQHAQPITLGYYFLGFFQVLCRDIERFQNAYHFVNQSPLGAAAVATTSHPLDRQYTAELLGFDSIVYNAYDAIAGRDYLNDVAYAICSFITNLSRIADDMLAWNTFEFGFMELPDDYSVTSSIMPQKKNPGALEFIRSAASWILGDTMAILSATKGVSYSDIKDADQYNYTPIWRSMDIAFNVTKLFTSMLPKLKWKADRMYKCTCEGFSMMTDLADYLVERYEITFREAHGLVGQFVQQSLDNVLKGGNIDVEILNRIIQANGYNFNVTSEELNQVLNPKACLERKKVKGGTSEKELNTMLANSKGKLRELSDWYGKNNKMSLESKNRLLQWEEVLESF